MGDYLNIINTAAEDAEKRGLEKGRSEGLAEGLAEGRAEAQHEMARKFKSLGVAIETIIEATGLDRETVEAM
jgi:predicted transposase/invertase (TIGR01784 family)